MPAKNAVVVAVLRMRVEVDGGEGRNFIVLVLGYFLWGGARKGGRGRDGGWGGDGGGMGGGV